MDVPTYRRTHEICREHFAAVGLTKGLDGAKDPCRACYRPARRPGTGFRFAVTHGTCLDAKRLVAMNPRPERPAMTPVELAQVGDNYLRAALERAAQAVAAAPDGSRHETVCREAYTLARLPLSAEQIEASLLPAAVHAMGEKRRREAERTIRDAVRARKGAA